MNERLLGGWQHIAEDAARLDHWLKQVPDRCTCGDGSAHLGGSCACCQAGEHRLDSGCTDCEGLLATVGDQIDDLVDATLRFLPFVELMSRAPFERGVSASDVRGGVMRVSRTFQALATAAGEFRQGGGASHLSAVKRLARQLAKDVETVDSMLRAPAAGRASAAAGTPLDGSHGSAA